MSIVNFAIPKTLDSRIKEAMQDKGFASKAEFFRFAALYFLDVVNPSTPKDEIRTAELSRLVEQEIRRLYKNKKIPSLEEQLRLQNP